MLSNVFHYVELPFTDSKINSNFRVNGVSTDIIQLNLTFENSYFVVKILDFLILKIEPNFRQAPESAYYSDRIKPVSSLDSSN